MATNIISINDARIDTEVFKHYNREAQGILEKISGLQAEFKELIKTVENTTSIRAADVSAYFKARFALTQQDIVNKGSLFDALNSALNS